MKDHYRFAENCLGKLLILLVPAVIFFWTAGICMGRQEAADESVLRSTLSNGLRVVVVRNTLAPVVTTMVNYLVGSNEAPDGFPGMAHAQEHMMFRGSPGLTANQLVEIIAAMGGMFNADTQQTVTQYILTVPAEDLDLALRIEAIRMQGVLDSEGLWAKERGAIEQEVTQDLSEPEYIFYAKVLSRMFKGTPYAHTPLGTVASFDKTTGAMLKDFYNKWYAPNNAILVIVGDLDPHKALEAVKKYFGPIPQRKIPKRPRVRLSPVKAETIRLRTDAPYGLAFVAFRMPGYASDDWAASQVLADVLSSQRGDLFALVPEGKALYAGFSLSTLPQAGLGYAMAAFPKGADTKELVKQVRRILAENLKKGFAADLVEASKKTRLTKSELQKNSVPGLANTWSRALAVEDRQSPQDDLNAIGRVTVADVNRVARRYLRPDHAIVTVLTPEFSGKPVSTENQPGTESLAPAKVKPVVLPDWAEKALNKLSIQPSTVHPVLSILPNGLKLIVQPVGVSNTVSLYGQVKNDPYLQTPPGREGVDEVLDQLLSYGTRTLDRVSFQKALDEIGARESPGVEFSLEVLADSFERGLQLLADNQLRPALPEKAFKTVRQQVAATVAGRLQSPDYLADRTLKTALLPVNDPALRQATPATVSSLTLKDVKNYHHNVFRPDLTVIVVIGKVTPEGAREAIEKYFGTWKATGPRPDVLPPSVPLNKPSNATIPDRSKIQDKVVLAETVGLNLFHPDYYALMLGNHVLGGAFYATRFYRDLREESGLVYYVSSSFDIGETRSTYQVKYGCDPKNVPRARAIVENNLRDMQNTPITPRELLQAKALLLREILLTESSVKNIATGLLHRAIHNLPLDEPVIAARHYVSLTAEQVQAACAKWLHPENMVQVIEGP